HRRLLSSPTRRSSDLAGIAAGAVLAAGFGGLVIWLSTNQYATGLALSLFGGGFAAFAGTGYTDKQLPAQVAPHIPGIPGLADIRSEEHTSELQSLTNL